MTIEKVFDSCTPTQRSNIIARLMLKGTSYSTAFNWCTGGRAPKQILRPTVVEVINAETEKEYSEAELWPNA